MPWRTYNNNNKNKNNNKIQNVLKKQSISYTSMDDWRNKTTNNA